MREIKFRVWDKREGLFWETENGLWFLGALEDEPKAISGFIQTPDRFVVQQFTGLKDREGKEIFEGDIIILEGAPYKYEIVWDKWRWGIDSKGAVGDFIQSFTSAVYERAIVVGNIFEKSNYVTV